jgi:hypothetical protein
MLLKEKRLKKMRRHRKIMEVLGERFFKIHTLYLNAYITKDEGGTALEYILGKEHPPSPKQSQSSQMII